MEEKQKRMAIFLDRDGVINHNGRLIYKTDQFELIDRVGEAIKLINESGYLAIVATNQPVVARNMCTIDGLKEIHDKMERILLEYGAKVDAIYYCPHHPDKGYPEENPDFKIECDCRKPKPGMLLQAALDHNIDLDKSYFIGDADRDMIAGRAAGVSTISVDSGVGLKDEKADHTEKDLYDAVKWIRGRY